MSAKTEANPFEDPFADLEFGEVEKATSRQVPEWDGPIPAKAIEAVDRAIKTGRRQIVACTNIETRQRLHSAIKAALSQRSSELAIHTRDKVDADGNLVQFTFTVGAPRARKSADADLTDSE